MDDFQPITRVETYLAALSGEDVTPPEPTTRIEEWLDRVIDNVDNVQTEKVTTAVDAWLGDHVDPDTGYVLDDTLTLDNAAAPAGKVGELKSELSKDQSIISSNLMGIDVQTNLYPGAADWSGAWENPGSATVAFADETLNGYPVKFVSGGVWKWYYKEFPVEAGKTYTFECYVKAADVTSLFTYITINTTTDPATVSPINKQYTPANYGLEANKWAKLTHTFTCAASGNVSPTVITAYGTGIYMSHFILVEGSSVFSLSASLNDKASVNDVSGLGDYRKYSFYLPTSETSTQEYWNPEITKNISSGTNVKVTFDSYSGSYLTGISIAGKTGGGSYTTLATLASPVKGGAAEFTTSADYVGLRIQFVRSQTERNVSGSVFVETDGQLGVAYDLMQMQSRKVYRIDKDGSGDFTSFVEGINAACQQMDSIVYVGAGTYDLLSELGSTYVANASSTQMGVVLKNRVHVICSSQTVLEMDYDGTLSNAKEWLSPINTGEYGCILENATIKDNNVRYSIHDDRGWAGAIPYTNKFIGCTLVHKNGKYECCIGGGLGENCDIEIRGCYLESDSAAVTLAYYHGNNHTGVTNALGHITVADNYFAGVGTFKLTNYGDSTKVTTALVSNNSFGSAPFVNDGSYPDPIIENMQMIAWNNVVRT